MGFTVEDMLIIARDKYKMELVAGQNGWANSISWLLMVEDTTIMENFKGKELAVTMGAGFRRSKICFLSWRSWTGIMQQDLW